MDFKREHFIVKTISSTAEADIIYYADEMPATMEEYSILTVRTASFDQDGDFIYSYLDDKKSRVYQIVKSDAFDAEHYGKLHGHNYFEMVFILEGEMDVRIESGKYHYAQGDGYLLNRNTRHNEVLSGRWKTLYLCFWKECLMNWPSSIVDLATCNRSVYRFFSQNFAEDIINNKNYMNFHYQHPEWHVSEIVETLDQIKQEMSEKKIGFLLIIYGLIARLLKLLDNSTEYVTEYIDLGSDSERNVAETTKRFIDEQKRRITRNELAQVLHYNGDYINRIFRKFTGESLRHYCQKVYMAEAARLLLETKLSAQFISSQIGFENRTQFYKIFKEQYGINPHEYRLLKSNTGEQ
jgi:AraC-like DNA-binding protein/mannose-6-phosphate isomerase-like protein (cupin superfamily)